MSNLLLNLERDQVSSPLHCFVHRAMNCEWELFIAGEEAEYARQAAFAAWEEVDRVEEEISRFVEGSDVARLNAAQNGDEVRVGPFTLECLLLAGEISELTQGAFDVMVARAMDQIRAGLNTGVEFLPTSPLLEIEPLQGVVRVLGDGVALDFGALGKGYAIDQMLRVLRDWSIGSALMHGGSSSLYALGAPPDANYWPLALRDPRDMENPIGIIPLRDRALSASSYQVQGRHIIDPRTGNQASGAIAAWCLSHSAARSDAISTALMVLSPDEIEQLQDATPGESGLILRDTDGGVTSQCWGDFETTVLNLPDLAGAPVQPVAAPITRLELDEASDKNGVLPINRRFRVHTACGGIEKIESGILKSVDASWLQLRADDGRALWVPMSSVRMLEEL